MLQLKFGWQLPCSQRSFVSIDRYFISIASTLSWGCSVSTFEVLKNGALGTHILVSIPKGQLAQVQVNYFSSSLSVSSFINRYL